MNTYNSARPLSLLNNFTIQKKIAQRINEIYVFVHKTGSCASLIIISSWPVNCSYDSSTSRQNGDISILLAFFQLLISLISGFNRSWHKNCNNTGSFRVALPAIRTGSSAWLSSITKPLVLCRGWCACFCKMCCVCVPQLIWPHDRYGFYFEPCQARLEVNLFTSPCCEC